MKTVSKKVAAFKKGIMRLSGKEYEIKILGTRINHDSRRVENLVYMGGIDSYWLSSAYAFEVGEKQ